MEPTSTPAKPKAGKSTARTSKAQQSKSGASKAAKPKATEADLEQSRDKVQKGKGPVGSRENPEVYENVPGHVIPILADEFDDFDSEAGRFLDGETAEEEFIGFRLKQGVYGQRQPGVQMIRVKLPIGGVTPEQMDAFASVIEKYVPLGKGHITTRQNVQMHHVPLPDAAELIREISATGLSSREGCGNTIRNVTGDPWAGVAADETFDPTGHAIAYVRYFVRHPTTQLMPRKVKTAFSCSDADRAITGIHDVGFIPRVRDGVRGFEVRVGGGTSIMPRIAPTLYEFVAADDGEYLKATEAVLRIFDRQDWLRPNRARARIKVLVDKIGIDAFRTMVDRELEGEWVGERDFSIGRLLPETDEEEVAPAPPAAPGSPNGDRTDFDRFLADSVDAQRQAGFSTVHVKITRGDLTPEQFRGLAGVMRDFCGGNARTTIDQNLVLRWVRDEALYDVYGALREIGLADTGVGTLTDVISCPGTDSCKLGITASMGLNQALQERVEAMNITDPMTRRIHLKMSGCPNGCGQHHIGTIGFYGASIKVGEHTMPAYIPHIGGVAEAGEVVYGARLKVRLPAKRVPDAVERWLRMYEAERAEGEEFTAFASRVGTGRFEDEIRELSIPAEFNLENMLQFIDWSRREPYQVIRGGGRVRGLDRSGGILGFASGPDHRGGILRFASGPDHYGGILRFASGPDHRGGILRFASGPDHRGGILRFASGPAGRGSEPGRR